MCLILNTWRRWAAAIEPRHWRVCRCHGRGPVSVARRSVCVRGARALQEGHVALGNVIEAPLQGDEWTARFGSWRRGSCGLCRRQECNVHPAVSFGAVVAAAVVCCYRTGKFERRALERIGRERWGKRRLCSCGGRGDNRREQHGSSRASRCHYCVCVCVSMKPRENTTVHMEVCGLGFGVSALAPSFGASTRPRKPS